MTGQEHDDRDGDDEPPPVTSDYRFAPIPEDLLYDIEVDHFAVRVYGVLMRHGLNPDRCYPSHARIAELAGVKPRSVQRPLRTLEARGWILRKARYNRRGDRISDQYHVFTERRPPAPSSAVPAPDDAPPDPPSAEGNGPDDRADERALDRADERVEDRAGQRDQEREPENESHLNESHPDQEQAGTLASRGDGPGLPADDPKAALHRAREAALVIADDALAWRDQATITNRRKLLEHIAREDVWPLHGQGLCRLAAEHPEWGPDQLAAGVTDLHEQDRSGRTAALLQEQASREFLEERAADAEVCEDVVRAAIAQARAGLEGPC